MSLTHLHIKNIVLIENLGIDFREGFCALTGETGAGKSILLDALGLALGARGEAGLVRKGTDQASVSATFDLQPPHPVFTFAQEHELDIEAGEALVIRRALTADGRSKAFINDQPVGVKLLKTLGTLLVEIHGQFDTQGLLDASTHLSLLDEYGQFDEARACKDSWDAYRKIEKELSTLQAEAQASRSEEEFLRAAIEDLDALSPEEGEEEKLSSLRESLMHRERILEALNQAYAALNQDNDPVRSAAGLLDRVSDKAGDALDEPIAALERASAEIDETRHFIESYCHSLLEEEHDLTSIDERLHRLRAQARKHQCSVDDLAAMRDRLCEKLNLIEYSEEMLGSLIVKRDQALKDYTTQAKALSLARKTLAAKLDKLVMVELAPLKLDKATFLTDIQPLPEPQWGPRGMDQVRFLVSTNPGQAPGPLDKIASGGEMSRFMLALKVVMAKTGAAPTLIFDEVDTGIGGSTADAVGDRLALLAKEKQVLVVTHAPQVAAKAANHFIVQKSSNDSATTTEIIALRSDQHREEEIARMLSGATITPEALAQAKKLLENAA